MQTKASFTIVTDVSKPKVLLALSMDYPIWDLLGGLVKVVNKTKNCSYI